MFTWWYEDKTKRLFREADSDPPAWKAADVAALYLLYNREKLKITAPVNPSLVNWVHEVNVAISTGFKQVESQPNVIGLSAEYIIGKDTIKIIREQDNVSCLVNNEEYTGDMIDIHRVNEKLIKCVIHEP